MGYLTQDEIAANVAMQHRVAQAFAQEFVVNGAPQDPMTLRPYDPDRYTMERRREWAASPGWEAAWASAKVTHPEPEYDPGTDEGVITDGMILSQVQAMLADEEPPP